MSSLCLSALKSLDDSLTSLYESFRKLKAAKSVDIAVVIQQLRLAAESARIVRELVLSELPEASWQNREELEALIEEIQKILEARTLEQLRSRLLALATELERGRIVHRRALRVHELNQRRDQAINELRSQAGLEGAPQTLPGPEAEQWIEWACGLKEPEDAGSLQTLRKGFAHLDNFVANLEPNMWIAAGSPTLESLPEPDTAADKTQPEQPRLETNGLKEPVLSAWPTQIALEAAKSAGAPEAPRFPTSLYEPSLSALDTDTLTPNYVIPPRTQEEIQRMQAQERALVAGMMGVVNGPVDHFTHPVEPPFTVEAFLETRVAPATANRPVEPPSTAEPLGETRAAPRGNGEKVAPR
ncbi:MAG: hypothetical protein ABSC64_09580 [Candidatus Korobacteraceae bacterium]|jgi:hypothetical protein